MDLIRTDDFVDPTIIDFVISHGWASLYIRDLIGVDLNIKNATLTLVLVLVSVKIYRVMKKKLWTP
jgi:hypothetical protein